MVAVPVGIVALALTLYTFRFFKQEHVLLLACVLSDVALCTIALHLLVITLPDPVKRASLLAAPISRNATTLAVTMAVLFLVSLALHLFSGVAILNSKDYLAMGFIPLLLVLFNRFF